MPKNLMGWCLPGMVDSLYFGVALYIPQKGRLAQFCEFHRALWYLRPSVVSGASLFPVNEDTLGTA